MPYSLPRTLIEIFLKTILDHLRVDVYFVGFGRSLFPLVGSIFPKSRRMMGIMNMANGIFICDVAAKLIL